MARTLLPAAVAVFIYSGCSDVPERPNGFFSPDRGRSALTHIMDGVSHEMRDRFVLGRSFFTIPWVEAPSATTARDGLGPLFSANSCTACHERNGAGVAIDEKGNTKRALVARLSQPSKLNNVLEMPSGGFVPDPRYGGQLSQNGNADVAAEGRLHVRYEDVRVTYADGGGVTLHRPVYRIENLAYGPLDAQTNIAAHLAPALIGMGLIEQIPEAAILANEDPDDRDNNGISGRANWVWHGDRKRMLGRFTWKAASPDVLHQSANAAHNDMGLSNPLYSAENCTDVQTACNAAPKGRGEFDLPQERLEAIAAYLTHLKVPLPDPRAKGHEGAALMTQLGCTLCHVDRFETAEGIAIAPYGDFLLHDMGEALSDGHAIFGASPREWRTAPLWGLGLHGKGATYLHDGRARSIEEAIVWHGGEAEAAKAAFMALDGTTRRTLIEYLEYL